MNQPDPTVKTKRPYDRRRREEQARRTRDRVIDSAEQLFRREGYGPTTIAAIAGDAGVSVDTIYKSFGGKAGLVRAIFGRALEGQGPIPSTRYRRRSPRPPPRLECRARTRRSLPSCVGPGRGHGIPWPDGPGFGSRNPRQSMRPARRGHVGWWHPAAGRETSALRPCSSLLHIAILFQ